MERVAVVGAGIFGCSIAVELSKHFDVNLYDRAGSILSAASLCNHLRHHYGYHYPNSAKTAWESIQAKESFEGEFGDCVVRDVSAYYGVSKTHSLTTPDDFLRFCKSLRLPYEISFPPHGCMNESAVDLCIKTPEPVYDPDLMHKTVSRRLSESPVRLFLNQEILGGGLEGRLKTLTIKSSNSSVSRESFDYVVNATYANYNNFNKWFGLPQRRVLYELVELLEVELPMKDKIGLTMLDKQFSSILPRGNQGTYTLGHVKPSVLRAQVSDELDPKMMMNDCIVSNCDSIIRRSSEYFPIARHAKVRKSIFVARIIKTNIEDTDERPTELTDHGNGIYSVFAGKIITCVDTAKKLSDVIMQSRKEGRA